MHMKNIKGVKMAFGFRKRNNNSTSSSGSGSSKHQDLADAAMKKDGGFLKSVIKNDSDAERRSLALILYNQVFFPNSNLRDVLSDLCIELNLTPTDVMDISKWVNNKVAEMNR